MSLDISVEAKVKSILKFKDGSTEESYNTARFHLLNVGTIATKNILAAEDQYTAYVKHIKKHCSHDVKVPISVGWDSEQMKEIYNGTEIWNEGKDHLEELKVWMEFHKKWDITWYGF